MRRRLARPDALPGDTRHDGGTAPACQQLPLDRFEVAPETFHAAVEAAFEHLAAQHPRRFVRIDATRPAIIVSRDIEKVIVQRLPAPAPTSTADTAERRLRAEFLRKRSGRLIRGQLDGVVEAR